MTIQELLIGTKVCSRKRAGQVLIELRGKIMPVSYAVQPHALGGKSYDLILFSTPPSQVGSDLKTNFKKKRRPND